MAEAGCSHLTLSNLIQAYSTHNNLEKGLCVIKTKILNKSVEWTDIKRYAKRSAAQFKRFGQQESRKMPFKSCNYKKPTTLQVNWDSNPASKRERSSLD
ncbi:hypothetical protein ABFA07_019948 [Porites harrisoni]